MKPTPVRFTEEQLARLARIAAAMAKRSAGLRANVQALIRLAVDRGLDAIERDLAKKR